MTGSKSTYFYQGCFRPNHEVEVSLRTSHQLFSHFGLPVSSQIHQNMLPGMAHQQLLTKYKSCNRKFTTVDFCMLISYTLQKLHPEANMAREIVNEYILRSWRKKQNIFILPMMLKRPDQEESRHTSDYNHHKFCCLLVGNQKT